MKVLLIQIDGKWPNLALMKISAYHKNKGDEVALIQSKNPVLGLVPFQPDWVYLSCIFDWNRGFALKTIESMKKNLRLQGMQSGGTGLGGNLLPNFMEHLMPNYSLYDIDYSIGFTTRGCFRKCPWCLVPKIEGSLREHSPIKEFLHPTHNKILLLDNNFTASSMFEEKLNYLIEKKVKVSFNQGLDIRLINEEKAKLLSEVKYYDSDFNERRLYFSFDDPPIEPRLLKGIEALRDAGIPSKHLMFYMLCGFNTTHEEDLHRFEVLNKLGVDPFVMIYNNRYDDPWIRHFARWVNRRRYKICDWKDYDHGNSQEIINNGSSPRTAIGEKT